MVKNINVDMNVLKCPACGGRLKVENDEAVQTGEIKIRKIIMAECEYCNKTFAIKNTKAKGIEYLKPEVYRADRFLKIFGAAVLITSIVLIGAGAVNLIKNMADSDAQSQDNKTEGEYSQSEIHKKHLSEIYNSTYEWPDNELADVIPKPDYEHGKIRSGSSDSNLSVDFGPVSQEEYEDYVDTIHKAGFEQYSDSSGNFYRAYNNDGYRVQVSYDKPDETVALYADAPLTMTTYEWPGSGLAKLLPRPAAEYGIIEDGSDRFSATVYMTKQEEFERYTQLCIRAGFDYKYDLSVSIGYFEGYDSKGNKLYIKYESNDYYTPMEIYLTYGELD